MSKTILKAINLKAFYLLDMHGSKKVIQAVNGVDLEIRENEVYGIAGESGCGKTTLGRSILRLTDPVEGTIHFEGINLLSMKEREFRGMRQKMQAGRCST